MFFHRATVSETPVTQLFFHFSIIQLSHFYNARFPELAIIDKGVAKRWTQSVVQLMQVRAL